MKRAIVNVATTPYYQRGQARLASMGQHIGNADLVMLKETPGPRHSDVPYAFKAYALMQAIEGGAEALLWCDSCILPVRSLAPLWERIERDGYWFSQAGWSNYEWTADSAYPDLFPALYDTSKSPSEVMSTDESLRQARVFNRQIQHVVATTFGLNVKHPTGRIFFDEYYRLASETRAFCGPWSNRMHPDNINRSDTRTCGPPDVRGHRHDQTAASVIAWRLGFKLTDPPDIFAYGRENEPHDERTILLADGSYT